MKDKILNFDFASLYPGIIKKSDNYILTKKRIAKVKRLFNL
jgi:hypothetical protein